ncbi:MAG: hypothetical protein AMXMBFR36_20930 [Acidobacteriota bacterium]
MGAGAERDLAAGIGEPPAEPLAHALGALEGALPLAVDPFGGVRGGLELAVEGDVRPGLVRVAGEQQPLADPEARVARRERVGRGGERRERDRHSSARIAQRSGKSGRKRVDFR